MNKPHGFFASAPPRAEHLLQAPAAAPAATNIAQQQEPNKVDTHNRRQNHHMISLMLPAASCSLCSW
jgi:hypothetical protein